MWASTHNITYPTLLAVHFDYDAGSRRTHLHDGTGDSYWTYGDGLHLTQQSSSRGTVTYGYDGDGRRHTMGSPGLNPSNSQALYVYGYDPAGRLTSLQNPFSETTSFGYNVDNTLAKKTLASGANISYGYDTAAQMNALTFAWPGASYSHRYTYTPAGELATRSEDDGGVNTFGYDGAAQLVSEVRTGPVPFSEGYSYDHNGNRLTMTQNGNLVQSFGYDAHDKLTGGIGETPGYDLNGNMTSDTLNGQHTGYTYDDEDRLTSITLPDGHTDSFTYNGLGMRLTKSDPTGNYAYFTDGLSPASSVLTDGYSTFTPGISETKGSNGSYSSVFYLADASGNSRGLLTGSNVNTDGYNWDAFGTLMSRNGSNPTGFAWNVDSGYQTDNDDGLTLLGHRYYDKRTGRFISQDPAGAGGNWYAYCNNNPVNATDPLGLDGSSNPFNSTVYEEGIYMVDPISQSQAGLHAGPNQSQALINQYQYFSIDKANYLNPGGMLLNKEHQFNIAVPKGTSLFGNLAAARTFNNHGSGHDSTILDDSLSRFLADADYINNHFKNLTVGDFKDKNFPGIGRPTAGTLLYSLADNGGNMNGGMSMEGLGLNSWEVGMTGTIHRSMMSGQYMPDDAQGAAVLQVGYSFATQVP